MFATPYLVVFDSLRLIAGIAAIALIGCTPFALTRPHLRWHQRLRFIGSALVSFAIVGAYLQALGTQPTQWWRTVAITIGVIAGLVGMIAFFRDQNDRVPPRGRHGL